MGNAKLYFKYGAMNSGKSTILLQTAYNYEERGMKVLVMKPSIDSKAQNNISSRLKVERQVDYLLSKDDSILNIVDKHKDVNCILVDEAQFLEPNQVDELLQVTIIYDITVICYGLRTDFKTNGFPGSTRLLEIAHKLEEMKTICRCGNKAMFNARFLDGHIVTDGDQVLIDGSSKITYESVCPACYFKLKENEKKLIKKRD